MLAKRCCSGPDCVFVMAAWRAEVAALPSRVFGIIKPRAIRWCGKVRASRLSQ